MQITDVRISIPQNRANDLLAFANIVIDGCFAVHGLKIIDGKDGLFVAMPSKPNKHPKNEKDKFLDIVHPLDHETRILIDNAVLDAYEIELNRPDRK